MKLSTRLATMLITLNAIASQPSSCDFPKRRASRSDRTPKMMPSTPQQIRPITMPSTPQNVVWSCALTPGAVADPGVPVRLAEAALKLHPVTGREGSDRLRILGAALYRAGRFAEAIRALEESHQVRGDDGDPRGFAFLAMAHHRLGHREEAQRWLDKLAAYQPKEGADFSWDDVEVRILRREAESLILGSPPAAPPPAASAPTRKAAGHPGAEPQ